MDAVSGFIVGLLTGYLFTWPALIVLFIIGMFFEHNDHRGWAIFFGLVALVSAYFYFAVPLLTVAYYALGYIGVGFLWSFWRYKRYVKAEVARILADPYIKESDRASCAKDLAPSQNLNNIVSWVIIWPISAVENFIGDFLSVIQHVVMNTFRSIYNYIYKSEISQLTK